MKEKIYRATHIGELKIGDIAIDCAVLEDGRRILSGRGLTKALGGKRGGAHWRRMKADKTGANLPVILSARNLRTFIDKDLEEKLMAPIVCTWKGPLVAQAVEATLLPDICNVFLKARDTENGLHPSQADMAKRAEILIRGLAHVGIIALVDEATGYQKTRRQDALQRILEKYLSEEWARWTRTFEPEFYEELFRVRGIEYDPENMKRPSYVGHWTNDLVYSRLAPGVLTRLRELNPRVESGYRARKHFQHLTTDFGYVELQKHLHTLTTLLKLAQPNSWRRFISNLNRVLPRVNEMFEMGLDEDNPD